jgi:predicted unusual protein kinase regulating ubiquinone biosynthesis (AarF/ABC1/UbiB family)
VLAVAAIAGAAWLWWPNGEYRPIQPGERGTVTDGLEVAREIPTGRPGLTAERRAELDAAARLRSAEQVAERLGNMKGALMKVGQMASYLDDGLPDPVRQALAQLQADAPGMSAELAAEVVERELGGAPDAVFVEWDPEPIAAASIGQVHRAVAIDPRTGREVAVAVKVQYPGVDEAIEADLANTQLFGTLLQQGFSGLDPTELVAEVRDRVTEELDYRREAANQTHFADFYRGHPTIRVPAVLPELSTGRVLTSELVAGVPFSEVCGWDQEQRNLAGETLFRFVFRSLYLMRAFNGDPHPGNYLFQPDGVVSFIDFGLVRYFTVAETEMFASMVEAAAVQHDFSRFRQIIEGGGLLLPDAPVSTNDAGGSSCSSSGSTSACTRCSATSAPSGTTGGWRKSCGRSPTASRRRRWARRRPSGWPTGPPDARKNRSTSDLTSIRDRNTLTVRSRG